MQPNDRIGDEENSEVMYKIPSKNCERVYNAETGRPHKTRVKEHHKEEKNIRGARTRAGRTRAANKYMQQICHHRSRVQKEALSSLGMSRWLTES